MRSNLIGAYAEIVLFLNGNQEYIAVEAPPLSREQALQAVPQSRRLSNPKAEVAALFAGEAGSAGKAEVDDAYNKYAGEAWSRRLGNKWGQRQICCVNVTELRAPLFSACLFAMQFQLHGKLYNLQSHSSRRVRFFSYTSQHLHALPRKSCDELHTWVYLYISPACAFFERMSYRR